jgi:arylsulfatase A-like enzyme
MRLLPCGRGEGGPGGREKAPKAAQHRLYPHRRPCRTGPEPEHAQAHAQHQGVDGKGHHLDNAFATNALCCPSRATILRGQYTHNHHILSNSPPLGGFEKFRYLGHEDSTVATWLEGAGYRTALVGKYLNGYSGTYIPQDGRTGTP